MVPEETMRPFGHTQAREERASLPLDDRLQEVWERYIVKNDELSSKKDAVFSDDLDFALFEYARGIIAPLQPTRSALHHHIIMTLPLFRSEECYGGGWLYPADLGIFVSAGYQCLPEKEIIYDLETPRLDNIGAFLQGKHLIIDGSAGISVGNHSVGRLTNNGTLRNRAGADMIGHFTNHGIVGYSPAAGMIGCYTNTRRDCPRPELYLGRTNRIWNIPKESRKEFLHDIKNPAHLSRDRLQDMLMLRYCA
jgi:hypothetical protein